MASKSKMLNIEFFTKKDLNQAKRFNFSPTLHHFHDFYGNIMCFCVYLIKDLKIFQNCPWMLFLSHLKAKQSGLKEGCSAKF